jgi:SAM-dependent methyltransferase
MGQTAEQSLNQESPTMDHANLEEYADPEIYDLENKSFEPDGPFYLALARRTGGPALEIGCGTGRVTIPIAEQGIPITGLDIAPAMLERAKEKAAHLALHWIQADARNFHLDTPFQLIFAAAGVFQHFLERADQEAALARIREHLAPKGLFAFDVIFPQPALLITDETEHNWFSYTDGSGRKVQVSGTEHYDPVRQIKTETAYRRWRDGEGREITRCAPLTLRYFFPQEMEALLQRNGFAIGECYGDWDLSPLTQASKSMIYVCQKISELPRL